MSASASAPEEIPASSSIHMWFAISRSVSVIGCGASSRGGSGALWRIVNGSSSGRASASELEARHRGSPIPPSARSSPAQSPRFLGIASSIGDEMDAAAQGTRKARGGRAGVGERDPRKGLAPEPFGSGACGVAGCTGLEPVASGVTVSETGLAGIGRTLQPVAIAQGGGDLDSSASPGFGAFSRPRVTPGLQSPIVKSVASERLLSVRQVASRLGVSTSTVYNLCREGKLVHVRVSNSIRVEPGVLEHLVGGGVRSG